MIAKLHMKKILMPVLLALGLSACGGNMDDLLEYVDEVKARPGGRIEPLPQIKPYQTFTYTAETMRSPFVPDRPQAAAAGAATGPRPDTNRAKEYLEQFPLDTLSMVGILERGVARPTGWCRRVTDWFTAYCPATSSARTRGGSCRSPKRRSRSRNWCRMASEAFSNVPRQSAWIERWRGRSAAPSRGVWEYLTMSIARPRNMLAPWRRRGPALAGMTLLFAFGLLVTGMAGAQTAGNSVQDVQVQALPGNRIELRLIMQSPAAAPLAFTIDDPARIALDLQDTSLALPSRRKDVGVGVLDTVLAAEANGRTRIVLNLDQMVGYQTRVDGNTIVVTLENAGASSSSGQSFAAAAPPGLRPAWRACGASRMSISAAPRPAPVASS